MEIGEISYHQPPDEQRQQELEQRYEAQKAMTPESPYKDIWIKTRGELEWILEQRRWSGLFIEGFPEGLPEGYERANLRGMILQSANLQGISLIGADLHDATLYGANLSEAHLMRASLQGIFLGEASLKKADLRGADLREAYLYGVDLCGADLRGSDLGDASLLEANLARADCTSANLTRVDLTHANLTMAILIDTNLSGADMEGTVLGDGHYGGVSVFRARLDHVDLARIDWSHLPYLGDEIQGDRNAHFQLPLMGWRAPYVDHQNAYRAYQELARILHNLGLYDEARRFMYRAHICQRRMLFRKILAWPTSISRYIFSHCLNLIAGYGYVYERALFWYIALISGFAWMYHSMPRKLSWNDCFDLSISSFHGAGFLAIFLVGPSSQTHAVVIEALIGLLIELAVVITFVQRFTRQLSH